ncbi:MAG: tRNA-specific adenosine deaminase, partial [Candidatus Magnetominusculus sp. LBB02]|nr:tRNA-specific adenosine deaminase [Candidatus Magnetominusculus sp. LBB02]
MEYALKEAQKAFLAGEIPVGAVIVDSEGQIIAAARNEKET